MIEVGRLVMKIAGRDSKKYAVVVEKVDDKFVLIDGQTRRKRCNIKHIESLNKILNIKKGATHADVVKELNKIGIEVSEKKRKEKKAERPIKKKVKKEKTAEPVKKTKK